MDDPVTSSQKGPASARRRSSSATASGRVVDIAGLPVLIAGEPGVRAAAVEGLLGALPDVEGAPRARISFAGSAPGLPARAPDEVRDGVSLWRDGEDLLAAHPGGLIAAADVSTARVAGDAGDPALVFRQLFQVVATHVLAYHDRFLLHGGGICSQQGSYLVLGPTGAGKSSLTVAAFVAGWKVLADDLIVLRARAGGIELTGIPRPWVVPLDVAERAGLRTRPAIGDRRDRRVVDGVALTGDSVPVLGTLLAAHGQTADPPEPLSSHDALKVVLGSFFSAGDRVLLQRMFPLAAELARLPAWTVRHPVDPAQRLASAVRNLRSISEGSPGTARP